MANTTQTDQTGGSGNAPIERFNDGAVKASIFRNVSKDGRPFFNVTFSRIYTDSQSGKIAETQSFSGTDILKVRRLADQAYHAVDRLRKQERDQSKEHGKSRKNEGSTKGANLAEQRDMLMGDGSNKGSQASESTQHHTAQNLPELER